MGNNRKHPVQKKHKRSRNLTNNSDGDYGSGSDSDPDYSAGRTFIDIEKRNPTNNSGSGSDTDPDYSGGSTLCNIQRRSLRLQNRKPTKYAYLHSGSGSDSDLYYSGGRRSEQKLELSDTDEGQSTATDSAEWEMSDSGAAATPLPDEKLLLFILNRLQKKDTYGVFAKPVQPDELPNYHYIIKHPMDFGTVRNKLAGGAYSNLEQFEKDVFLISLNAMCYNSPGTIYFRQARSIYELARKYFENLKQESDDEPEPKTVTERGRRASKITTKFPVARASQECADSDLSYPTLANTGDSNWSILNYEFSRKRSTFDKPGIAGISGSSLSLCNTETLLGEQRAEKSEEFSVTGFPLKGLRTRSGKKPISIDENRRNTYMQPQPSKVLHESPILSTFEGEKKQLIAVGLHTEHAYARSLARFAANVGPVGWAIAAEKIKRALPPGMKFGCGWVGDSEAPQQSQAPLLSSSPPHRYSLPRISPNNTKSRGNKLIQRPEQPSTDSAVEEQQFIRSPDFASATSNKSSDSVEGVHPSKGLKLNIEAGSNHLSGGSVLNHQSRAPLQVQRHNPGMPPSANGFRAPFGFNLDSQLSKTVIPATSSGFFGLESPMTHARALDLVSRSNGFVQTPVDQFDVEWRKLAGNSNTISFSRSATDPDNDPQGASQGLALQPNLASVPPDISVRFKSPVSLSTDAMINPQQLDLALSSEAMVDPQQPDYILKKKIYSSLI